MEDGASKDTIVTAMNHLLNDTATQHWGEPFDPKKVSNYYLDKMKKAELIALVKNYAWFTYRVAQPFLGGAVMQQRDELDRTVDSGRDQRTHLESVLNESQMRLDTLQEKVISLQDELLAEKNKTIQKLVGSVETTVKEGLKSYASAVKETCSASLAPAKLQAAMRKVSKDEDRSRNLIIYGLNEDADENTEEAVLAVLEHTDEKPKLESCRRLGERRAEKGRPIMATFHTREMVRCVLAKSAKLRQVEGYSRVYLSPDRTVEQRLERKRLVGELCEKRENFPEKKFVIRRGEVSEVD